MGFFDVKDGEGGTVEDRVAIVAVACFAVAWIPVMLIWKCVSVARRRASDAEQGNVPVTTHASDPEKHPLPPQMVPGGRFSILSAAYNDGDDDDDYHDDHHSGGGPYRSSEADGPRRPEPLAGGRRHKRRGESARDGDRRHAAERHPERARHRGDFDSARCTRPTKHEEEEDPHEPPHHQRGRRSEYEHYPGEPLRVQGDDEGRKLDGARSRHRSHRRRHHEARRDLEAPPEQGDSFEEVSI